MTTQAYTVPVILPDLRKEESYRQIVDALEYLEAVANDIFNRISYRVGENRDELVSINNRINVAQAKIDKLRSSTTKATRVFSSPKYPAPDKITEYHTIYQQVDPMLQKVRKNRADIESRLTEVTEEVLESKKRPYFLNLRVRQRGTRAVRLQLDDPEQGEGLGSLPRHLPSVSSLLLFNTAENPYKKYVVLDPLSGAMTKTRDKLTEEENELSEAPITITQGEELGRGPQDSVMYVPPVPELPELEVPETLPHLLYIAADEFYTADVGQSIAPSLANVAVPDLPNLADPDAPAANEPILPPPTSSGAAAPPPPPPPTEPPPPPPPPESNLDSSQEDEGGATEGAGDMDGGRADLMAAIREAGGASKAGLKSAEDKKQERKAKKEEVVESGGDLLTDLSAALGRRRKAMSGKEKERMEEKKEKEREEKKEREDKEEDHNLGGGTMMDNISRLIPPPPVAPKKKKSRAALSESTEDDPDW